MLWTQREKMQNKKNEMHARVFQSIERCREFIKKKQTLMDREAIEHLSSIQKLPQRIEILSRNYQECDEKKLKGLDR